MGSTSQCNSLIGHSLKWRWCSLVWPISLLKKKQFGSLGTDQSSFRLPAQSFDYFFNPPSGFQRKSTSGQYYTFFSGKESKKEWLRDAFWRFSQLEILIAHLQIFEQHWPEKLIIPSTRWCSFRWQRELSAFTHTAEILPYSRPLFFQWTPPIWRDRNVRGFFTIPSDLDWQICKLNFCDFGWELTKIPMYSFQSFSLLTASSPNRQLFKKILKTLNPKFLIRDKT